MSIARLAAEAINNEPVEIVIGKDTYNIPRPTLRTMMEVSKFINMLPPLNMESDNISAELMNYGKHGNIIAKILAVFISGAKPHYNIVARIKRTLLVRKIEYNYTIGELYVAYSEMTTKVMQIQSFFALTTSLSAVNMTKSKEVVETTALGQ